jgi:beta-phosphoglucomutase-like phosphatase (HAD superfamily)
LEGAGLRESFQVVVGAEDVSRGKPSPEGFETAMRLLNRDSVQAAEILLPEECLVIEDSPWGLEAGRAAGMKCVGLLTSYPAERLGEADLIAQNLQTLSWKAVERLFS